MSNSPRLSGFSDEQSRAILAELAKLRAELSPRADRVLDRRKTGTIRPRPGDVVRANSNDVVVLPHPRSAKGRAPVVVLVESQPVAVLAESGTVNDQERVSVTTLGAMEWFSTGTEWWGTAVGGETGGGSGSDPPATGSEDGFLSRVVYANAASAKVGTTFMGTTVTAAPASWGTAADIPDGNWFRVGLAGAGGGGSSGVRATGAGIVGGNAGAGGGGGAWRELTVSRADLVALLPISITVPLGGAGGASTSLSTDTNTAGAAGTNPTGATIFGPWSVFPGGSGNGNVVASAKPSGGGGGWTSAGGGGATSGTANVGGGPFGGAAGADSLFGGGGGNINAVAAGTSLFGGSGGGSPETSAAGGVAGRASNHGGAGGGSGGFANGGATGSPTAGGASGLTLNAGGAAGTTATSAAGARTGTDGSPGTTTVDIWRAMGSGGGGGGGAASTNSTTTAGAGGAGGFPGGGGGGGGSADSAASGQTSTSGAGGAGGDACIVVEAFA